jgi:GT2 family glycosyltransferase
MAKVAITIVNYNAGEHLLKCLESIKSVSDEVSLEVWVVDNNSTDDSLTQARKQYSTYHYIENPDNRGFGRAHNQALQKAQTEYLLVLNPDTLLAKGNLKSVIDYMDQNPDVGAVTPKIVFENGVVDMTAHRGFPTPKASLLYFLGNDSLYHMTGQDMTKPHEVDVITGAFLLTRKKVLDEVGYFDEDYFMYAEDIDLCYRIKQAGYKIMYLPDVEVLHYKGISTGLKKHSQHLTKASLETRQKMTGYFYSTMKIFYDKHYKNKYPFFVNWLVYLGIYARWWLAKRKLTV